MLYHDYAMTHPFLDVLSIVHIKLTLIGIRSIMTHHVPRMKDNFICSTDCACCIMLMQWLTNTALRQNHIITSTVLSPYESYNVYRLVKWVTQLLTAPIATWKLYLDPRVSRMTQPISQLVSWPYTEKRLPLVTANEKHWLQFWDPYIVMFCKIANHWPWGFMETRVRGISSHFHDGVPMQRLCQYLLQKRWFEKTQRIRSWRRSLFVWQMFQNVQQKGRVRKTRTYLFHNM
jgi:hypothetical protein